MNATIRFNLKISNFFGLMLKKAYKKKCSKIRGNRMFLPGKNFAHDNFFLQNHYQKAEKICDLPCVLWNCTQNFRNLYFGQIFTALFATIVDASCFVVSLILLFQLCFPFSTPIPCMVQFYGSQCDSNFYTWLLL